MYHQVRKVHSTHIYLEKYYMYVLKFAIFEKLRDRAMYARRLGFRIDALTLRNLLDLLDPEAKLECSSLSCAWDETRREREKKDFKFA